MKLLKLLANLFMRRKVIPISIEDNYYFYFDFLRLRKPKKWDPIYDYYGSLCDLQQPEYLTDSKGKEVTSISTKMGKIKANILIEEFN
jgi:hypothetical protein